jgi:hypothetical protein
VATLSPLTWYIWFAVILAQSVAAAWIAATGSWRRWPSLLSFLLVLSARDMLRLADYLVWQSPALEFWSYWWASLAAELAEVWIVLQITLELAGATPRLRRTIVQAVPGLGGVCMALALAMALQPYQPMYVCLSRMVLMLDQTVLYLFMAVALMGSLFAEWSGGVRGIALGFALELTSGSSASWLTLHNLNPEVVAHLKSVVYLTSLAVWVASMRNVSVRASYAPAGCIHFAPIVQRYADLYMGLVSGFERVTDKK